MEAGAAERAARGQRRERVTDWPLMGEPRQQGPWPDLPQHVEDAIDERGRSGDELAATGSPRRGRGARARDEYTLRASGDTEARGSLNQRPSSQRSASHCNAMDLIEVDNPSLRCMVPKTYARLASTSAAWRVRRPDLQHREGHRAL